MKQKLLADLRQRLGGAGLLTHGLAAYESDWRRRYAGRALAVARPSNAEEVAAVVRLCAAAGVGIVPQGGNTGLVGGSTPDDSGEQLVLSLARMNRVRGIDAANLTLTAEAGCILQTVQEAAAAQELLFPLSLAAEGSCTIGGNLATNAGGTQVLRYGNARELCLGLEVVTAQGDIWQGLSGLRKDNTGYDLRDLLIGSEGTLGIITAATLKLHPQPAAQMTALAACADMQQAVALLMLARSELGPALSGFEVMNGNSLALVLKHFPQLVQPFAAPWAVLLEASDSESADHARSRFESLLQIALESSLISDAAVAQSRAQSQAFWHLRESIPLAQSQEGLNIKHDIALPLSAIPSFVRAADSVVKRIAPDAQLINFGHLGDGNLHYNVQAPLSLEPQVNAAVYDLVGQHGGSISAEHGIGRLKRDELAARKSPVALSMMRSIKQALDPQGILNPGRVI